LCKWRYRLIAELIRVVAIFAEDVVISENE
jgi:hypothetical protein